MKTLIKTVATTMRILAIGCCVSVTGGVFGMTLLHAQLPDGPPSVQKGNIINSEHLTVGATVLLEGIISSADYSEETSYAMKRVIYYLDDGYLVFESVPFVPKWVLRSDLSYFGDEVTEEVEPELVAYSK